MVYTTGRMTKTHTQSNFINVNLRQPLLVRNSVSEHANRRDMGHCFDRWLSDTYKGLQNCWKTPCDKYIWNPIVELYYGLCCHLCKYKKKDKLDDNYSKASTQEEFGIQMNHHPTNNDDKMSDYENENGTLERRNSSQ